MALTASDFFQASEEPGSPWGPIGPVVEVLDRDLLEALIAAPMKDHSDVEASLALMDLVRDDLTAYGTGGGEVLNDAEMRLAILALRRVTERAGYAFKLPFRDHSSWRSYWSRNNGYGSWQARRNLLAGLFDQPYAELMAAQERHLDSTLVEAVSPRDNLGWPSVDTEVGELRRHFRSASTPQDYRAVGNDCVHLLEALSRQVYVHGAHGIDGEPEPSVDKTKLRLDRYIEARLPGSGNAEMRKYARASIELAQAVKHRATPTRTEAGVSADAVIALANMLRRLAEETTGERG